MTSPSKQSSQKPFTSPTLHSRLPGSLCLMNRVQICPFLCSSLSCPSLPASSPSPRLLKSPQTHLPSSYFVAVPRVIALKCKYDDVTVCPFVPVQFPGMKTRSFLLRLLSPSLSYPYLGPSHTLNESQFWGLCTLECTSFLCLPGELMGLLQDCLFCEAWCCTR